MPVLHDKFAMKMALTGHCEECARLVVLYLEQVRDHSRILEEYAQMDQGSEAFRDAAWRRVAALTGRMAGQRGAKGVMNRTLHRSVPSPAKI